MKINILLVAVACVLTICTLNSCQSTGNLGLTEKSVEPFGYYDQIIVVKEKNLMWAANDSPIDINLADAKVYCLKFRGGGFYDWRLPSLIELNELYASDLWKHSQNSNNKINIYSRLWSSDISYYKGKPQCYGAYSFHGGGYQYIHENTDLNLRVP